MVIQTFIATESENEAVFYPESSSELYERDFNLWIESTVKLLNEGRLTELDVPNLIEEVETMGRSEKFALSSDLVIVLLHLLKWKYQPNKRTRSWEKSIAEHRRRIIARIEGSPSLRGYYQQTFNKCYANARKQASIETKLSPNNFPEISPFSCEQVLDEDFLPE